MGRVRLLLAVVLTFVLAGCTQGSPGLDPDEVGSCPSWVQYPHKTHSVGVGDPLQWYHTGTQARFDVEQWDFRAPSSNKTTGAPIPGTAFGSTYEFYEGRPLDFLVFDFAVHGQLNKSKTLLLVVDAEVHLQFIASEGGYPTGEVLAAWDVKKGPASAKTDWVFKPDPATNYAYYNLTLQVDLAPIDQDPNPRGVFLHWTWEPDLDKDPETPSILRRGYAPDLWYRTCSKDGTRF